MNPFSSFPKDDARVEKSDGSMVGPYNATFAGSTIVIWDAKADIEEGDVVLRTLPSGKDERSQVTQATFFQKMHSIPSHYQIKFKKWSGSQMQQKPSHNITIHGAQSVQIGDYNTQNIINSIQALKNQIESSAATAGEKEEAKSLLAKFLGHPLVTSILGAAAGAAIG
ncbi:RIP homotypic interaction motif-containing protein [Aeromonas caviae]|uniref:RIP homotypic interaction motif-containing protein n=1 Tax=Aeromonas caviae TaxID=648 RepID=UPI0019D43170|nr:RIP homotypic interaction motif-containing protein [Aeromonas caviae]